ncbi:hypothetical protein FJZ18_01365 [Candidatus Pacearchaeota archaeon]|nr:hypothetical protein [Candidatus Pacearchaeota archaeon]
MKKMLANICMGILGLGLLAGAGARTHSRLQSRPSQAIEQQMASNSLYQEVASQSSEKPIEREMTGLYIEYILPFVLKHKADPELFEYLKTNRIDSSTGRHRSYSDKEQAILWHVGCDPNKPSMSKDYVLAGLAGMAFRKP